ncbi:ATP-binding cassette, subfamily B [Streptomyces sp. MnatMP-M77]|uniref:ABC transporter ATP-binding protein n=1 Tax=unclassified Streptomyces TaxID=2593676 RepID=UPI000804F86F|nr:ABC transporter ATP-binding protein [Streptomyces sp. MnatMP-M77]MYT79729.1 ATP-binding cassette domain-containing protein [Streptomyces sp. SID8364]SBV05486.1 ATP-binding cassette, subfamily B [Streptomyces sp. MnatMP-M77]
MERDDGPPQGSRRTPERDADPGRTPEPGHAAQQAQAAGPVRERDPKAEARAARAALASLLAPVRVRTRIAMALQIIGAAATVVPYIAIAELAKTLLAPGPADPDEVRAAVLITVVGLSVRALSGGVALALTHFADVALQASLRRRIVARLGRAPLGWFTANSSATVRKAAQNDVHDLHYLVAHSAVETTAAVTVPAVGLGYLFWLDWRLALLALATLPLYAGAYAYMMRDFGPQMGRLNAGIAAINKAIVEFVTGIGVVKTFGRAGEAHAGYREAATRFGDHYSGWVRPMLKLEAFASMAVSPPVVLLVNLAGGVWFVHRGWVSPVDVLTSSMVALVIPSVLVTLGFGAQARREASAAAERIAAVLDTPVLPEAVHPRLPDGNEVELHDVTFSYDGAVDVLDGVSLRLAPGTVTALVGPSGSGKSTLASLAIRFHDVTGGRITIGGVDVREIATEQLYRHIGFVLQDVQLLRTSVRDNIRLARPDASEEEVREAARAARIDRRIEELPRGYDSVVGEDAVLSGGEAQRVSIARALLAGAPVLVLDEATAFADPESEAAIQDAIARLVRGRTVLVIAHRLPTIVEADQIAVLRDGRIVERGRHPELLAAEGLYARMWATHERAVV